MRARNSSAGGARRLYRIVPVLAACCIGILTTTSADRRVTPDGQGSDASSPPEKPSPISVAIDILPGDSSKVIELGTRGAVPVAILGSASFDPAMVDPSTIDLAGSPANKERAFLADANGDGFRDLVLRVRRRLLRLEVGATQATLRGTTFGGVPIIGSGLIQAKLPPPPDSSQEKLPPLPVQIDALPGDASNVIDLGSLDDVAVALLGSPTFDATTVSPESINLAGAPVGEEEDGELKGSLADVNGDGLTDRIVAVPRRLLRVVPGTTGVVARGTGLGGREIEGSDAVQVVGSPQEESATFDPESTGTFSNPAPITIPSGAPATTSGPATPYPSNVTVSGLPGTVLSVAVTLHGLTHTFPDDVDVLLVGPGGQSLILVSDVGGSPDAVGLALSFSDAAASTLPDAGPLVSGTFRPTNVGLGDTFPAPAPTPSAATTLSVFDGTDPNGTWSLYVVDDGTLEVGSISLGWSLSITTSIVEVCNTGGITIGDDAPATPYPSTIDVSGVLGIVTSATPTLRGLSHTFPDDVDVLLAGPTGANAVVLSDVGGFTPASNVTLTLDDGAPLSLPDAGPLVSGTFQPTNFNGGDAFPPPAVAPSGGSALSVFQGTNPNGTWSLYVVDDAAGDAGSLAGGFCLALATTSCAGGPPCDDGNPCTDDVCDLATGRCASAPDDTNACSDADPCTADACVSGQCVSNPTNNPSLVLANPGALIFLATSGPTSPYPSTITVPDLGGRVVSLTVTLGGVNHTFPDDLDVLLAGPAGQNLIVLSDVGGNPDALGLTLTLSDAASSSLPDAGPLVSGVFRPTNVGAGDTFPAPAPAPSTSTVLSVFQGTNPAGVWSLYVVDDFIGDTGSLTGGWSLNLTINCDDGDPCTTDSCDPVLGCVHSTIVCDDGDSCTADTCSPTGCVFTPIVCNDGNECTDDSCDQAVGCLAVPDDTNPCSDGNACTGGDHCGNGACAGTPAVSCDDDNPCTDDACDPATGQCAFTPDDANTCDDGNACTSPDACRNGQCACGALGVCNGTATMFASTTPVAIPPGPAVVSSTMAVSGLPPYLFRVRMTSLILHTFNADLDITLTSPAGTVVTITTDNGGGFDNVFHGTLWDDKANPGGQVPYTTNAGLVTDHPYSNNVVATPLVPEEAFGAFLGENPNGPWTLTVSDDTGGEGGSLSGWSLEVTTLPSAPVPSTAVFGNTTPVAIPDASAVTSTIAVSGAGTQLGSVRMTTAITHTFPGDLDITLTSPAGTIVTLTTDNGASAVNAFNGTLWDDKANPGGQVPYTTNAGLVTDHPYVPDTLASPLAPEEAFAAFQGEDPNGVWTLTISDDEAFDVGSLNGWSLQITTVGCPASCDVSCDDGDLCTADSCDAAAGCVHAPVVCDDGNPCTDDTCDPATGCGSAPDDSNACTDGNACTTGDHCDSGVCLGGMPPNCNDGNPCTDDTCNPATGCVFTPDDTNACTDGNACTSDACVGGLCRSAPIVCDDGNACTDDACQPATGCVFTPDDTNTCTDTNACTTADHCASGTCVGGPPPTCNDGNVCTNDACDPASGCTHVGNGSCVLNPKPLSYWKRVCSGPSIPGETITPLDVDCVNDACTFANVATVAELCDRLNPTPPSDKCEQAEAQLMALKLNLCRGRVAGIDGILSTCTSNTTVGQSVAQADALLCDPGRNGTTCTTARCESEEINSGKALGTNSLLLEKQATGIRLTWSPPYTSTLGLPQEYRVWRRMSDEAPFALIQETSDLYCVDPSALGGVNYQYEVTPVR